MLFKCATFENHFNRDQCFPHSFMMHNIWLLGKMKFKLSDFARNGHLKVGGPPPSTSTNMQKEICGTCLRILLLMNKSKTNVILQSAW